MKQEIQEVKTALKESMAHGDMAEAARIVGVHRKVFREWLHSDEQWPSVDARNIRALKKVIRARNGKLERALAA